MFKWNYTAQVETNATPEQIWAMWKNVETWPHWDSELEWVKLNGPFEIGTKGRMQPSGGPVVDFILTEIQLNKKFVNRAKLPLTTLEFTHVYEANSEEKNCPIIRHSVAMKGLLAPLFGLIIGRKIKKHLRVAMEDLSNQATKM
jgi:hypothetical protein